MVPSVAILGVYPVLGTREPVHLMEVLLRGLPDFDFGTVTQSIEGKPPSNWQVAYDEHLLDSAEADTVRAVFFFHYLDLGKVLETPVGSLILPGPTDMPTELRSIEYEPP